MSIVDLQKNNLLELEDTYAARNYLPLNVVLCKGHKVWVWDQSGKRYMDCLSAYSAVNQGHRHQKIIKTLIRQAKKLSLVSRAFRNNEFGLFCKELCDLTSSHMVLPMNSGTEAVESCIKAVRKWGYECCNIPADKAEIIVCDNNFHGRSIAIVGFSSNEQYKKGFGPFPGGFVRIPFGDAEALENAITENTVAFLVEPIQGEAGVIVPPKGYLKAARDICTKHNILLVTDEIQTGLGRTGTILAEEHEGIEADMTVLGKALSGGFYPVSAVLASDDVLGILQPGDHGNTFAGNPLACAVARTAIRVIKDEGMLENAATIGKFLMDGIQNIQSPYIKEVRGKGLMIGIEFTKEAGNARKYCEYLMTQGILCKETHDHTIRIAPPLIITKKQAEMLLEILDRTLSKPIDKHGKETYAI